MGKTGTQRTPWSPNDSDVALGEIYTRGADRGSKENAVPSITPEKITAANAHIAGRELRRIHNTRPQDVPLWVPRGIDPMEDIISKSQRLLIKDEAPLSVRWWSESFVGNADEVSLAGDSMVNGGLLSDQWVFPEDGGARMTDWRQASMSAPELDIGSIILKSEISGSFPWRNFMDGYDGRSPAPLDYKKVYAAVMVLALKVAIGYYDKSGERGYSRVVDWASRSSIIQASARYLS